MASNGADSGKQTARMTTVAIACITALLLAAAIGALLWIASCEVHANPDPAPTLAAADRMQADGARAEADGEWPEVDWGYWASVNPDVIGWVSVPGTNVSQPIARASANDPDYYLDHDAYRRYNPMGCPYLDSECADGLKSLNAVVCGHNWAGGQVFSDLARMSDEAYASEHPTVLLQTPTGRTRLSVQAVEVTSGDAPTKATAFASAAEFQAWCSERWAASCVRLSPQPAGETCPDGVLTLVTCSYAHANDRTLVYAAAAASDAGSEEAPSIAEAESK